LDSEKWLWLKEGDVKVVAEVLRSKQMFFFERDDTDTASQVLIIYGVPKEKESWIMKMIS
jgi:hypothetical protein